MSLNLTLYEFLITQIMNERVLFMKNLNNPVYYVEKNYSSINSTL